MIRGFMLDSARCLEKRAYYEEFFRFAAARGVNTILWHFTDDQGCSLQFDCEPDIASPNALSKSEMRQLLALARELGIDVIPELASLGHCVYITQLPEYRHLNESDSSFSGMCPLSPVTRKVLEKLIAETASLFESPNFHVGLDEANIGGHPLTQKALETRSKGDIFAEHVRFLHGVLRKRQRRLWMWGDFLLHDRTVAQHLPRDIVMCNWHYTPEVPAETTQYLLDEGFDVMLCSALISHDQTIFPGEQFALPNIRNFKKHETLSGKGHVLGSICTIWTPVRFLAESLWLGADIAATIMREKAPVAHDQCIRVFARDYYGFEPGAPWVEACTEMLENVPTRQEWLAVAKLSEHEKLWPEQTALRTARWRAIARMMHHTRPMVRRHAHSYEALMLVNDLLAHFYESATSVLQEDTVAVKMHLVHGEDILRRLDATWNAERYANDPRKYGASIPHFQDDHLIPLMQANLLKLRNCLKVPRTSVVAG